MKTNYSLSYLMGASDITDKELTDLKIDIVEQNNGVRKLKIPGSSITDYKELIRNNLDPGFWNEMVGTKDIIFIFKHKDGTVAEFVLSDENQKEIAQLCSLFNDDPIEKTSDILSYLAENEFYSDFIEKYHRE